MPIDVIVRADELILRLDRSAAGDMRLVRDMPSRKYDPIDEVWIAPLVKDNWQYLKDRGVLMPDVSAPTLSLYMVGLLRDGRLALRCPRTTENIGLCAMIPDDDARYWPSMDAVLCECTAAVAEYIESVFPTADWTEEALQVTTEAKEILRAAEDKTITSVDWAHGGSRPRWAHQQRALDMSADKKVFALLMEMGTGKTRVIIDNAQYLYSIGEIRRLLIITVNSVKDVWDEEWDEWARKDQSYHVQVYRSVKRGRLDTWRPGLKVLITNVESLSHESGRKAAGKFLRPAKGMAMIAVDECTRIKTPASIRTRGTLQLAKFADYRRILTGAPITKSPLDVFAPYKFLDWRILGHSSFTNFRNRHAVMGGWGNKEIFGYRNLLDLSKRMYTASYRVLRKDCMDLPPKSYTKRFVEMTAEQRRIYNKAAEDMLLEIGDKDAPITVVITKILRLRQIAGGFVQNGDKVELIKNNPKLAELLSSIEDSSARKAIIWTVFKPEIAMIAAGLREKYGDDSVVEFHGSINEQGRKSARARFQAMEQDEPARFFVGQVQTGGIGLTLTAAEDVYYYTNAIDLESRLQSEDRAHRGGLTHPVLYIDIVAKNSIDTKFVLPLLRGKFKLAASVTGDQLREWI